MPFNPSPTTSPIANPICSVDGCTELRWHDDLCSKHANRFRTHGDVNKPVGPDEIVGTNPPSYGDEPYAPTTNTEKN